MSKPSPFLQEVVENMLDKGASDTEVQEVVQTLSNDKEAAKEACNSRDGYRYNEETGVCELKVETQPVSTEVKTDDIEVKTDIDESIVGGTGGKVDTFGVTEKEPTLSKWFLANQEVIDMK